MAVTGTGFCMLWFWAYSNRHDRQKEWAQGKQHGDDIRDKQIPQVRISFNRSSLVDVEGLVVLDAMTK